MTYLEMLKAKIAERLGLIEGVTNTAATENRDVSEAEDATVIEARSEIDALQAKLDVAAADIERRDKLNAVKLPAGTTPPDPSTGDAATKVDVLVRDKTGAIVTIRREPFTYEMGNGHSFFGDTYQFMNRGAIEVRSQAGAIERVEAHIREMNAVMTEDRATLTAGLNGIVPPQYIQELVAAGLYNGRVVSGHMARYPLPASGTVFHIPRVGTTAAKAGKSAKQVEGAAVQEATVGAVDETFQMTTIAAFDDMSRQALDRGVIVDSLVRG